MERYISEAVSAGLAWDVYGYKDRVRYTAKAGDHPHPLISLNKIEVYFFFT